MKSLSTLSVLALIVLALIAMSASRAEAFSCCPGNVNTVGGIDLGDLSALSNYLSGGGYILPCPQSADVNCSGVIDLADLSLLTCYLTGGGCQLCTCPLGSVTDYDGNVYQTKVINGQEWMIQNLKVTHYRNGDAIPNVTDSATWMNDTTGAYCNYNNNASNATTYGRLYNWYAVSDARNIAPTGWHVPTDSEWIILEVYLDSTNYLGGGKAKEAGYSHWQSPNTGASNKSSFTALPAGSRYMLFQGLGTFGVFWTATPWYNTTAATYGLNYNDAYIVASNKAERRSGCSVRCVKNN